MLFERPRGEGGAAPVPSAAAHTNGGQLADAARDGGRLPARQLLSVAAECGMPPPLVEALAGAVAPQ